MQLVVCRKDKWTLEWQTIFYWTYWKKAVPLRQAFPLGALCSPLLTKVNGPWLAVLKERLAKQGKNKNSDKLKQVGSLTVMLCLFHTHPLLFICLFVCCAFVYHLVISFCRCFIAHHLLHQTQPPPPPPLPDPSCGGELWTQKLKLHLMRTLSLQVLPWKPGVGQYIAMHALLTAGDFFLSNVYPFGPFACIFSRTSSKFFLC